MIRKLIWGAGLIAAAAVFFIIATAAVFADPVREAMQEYTDFATYDAGIILPEQLTEEIFTSVTFVDTRTTEEHADATIPGALHIEWREMIARMEELPEGGKIVLFCNSGALSAQAAFGLRVLGREDVLVLQTGFVGWRQNAAYRP